MRDKKMKKSDFVPPVILRFLKGFGMENELYYFDEFDNWQYAMEKARKSVENRPELRYIVEETDGHVNNYGELITTVIAESD